MRATVRLLASVPRTANAFLEPGAPTGLTGLLTHSSPRTTLLYLYSSTLEKLKTLPESSIYRQSTEALTRHRMSIVESIKPAGLEQWQNRVQKTLDEHPDAFRKISLASSSSPTEFNIVWKESATQDAAAEDDTPAGGFPEGPRVGSKPQLFERMDNLATEATYRKVEILERPETDADWTEVKKSFSHMATEAGHSDVAHEITQHAQPETDEEWHAIKNRLLRVIPGEPNRNVHIEPEPALTAEQIGEIEGKIGAGLVEEVIRVAEGECELVDKMAEHKVWEELEEKPAEGQWVYHERGTHVPQTQAR